MEEEGIIRRFGETKGPKDPSECFSRGETIDTRDTLETKQRAAYENVGQFNTRSGKGGTGGSYKKGEKGRKEGRKNGRKEKWCVRWKRIRGTRFARLGDTKAFGLRRWIKIVSC